ncbi:MAG: cytochrome c [Acidobacteriota bacterium]
MQMPRWLKFAIAVLVALSFVPLVVAYRYRQVRKPRPRLHLVFDMDDQSKYKPQEPSDLFADGRAMRPRIDGTVPREELVGDPELTTGRRADGSFVDAFPVAVDRELLLRGQDRFNIYCAPCHGWDGFGQGVVARRADRLQEGTWVPPTSLHDKTVRERPVGHIYNTIRNGIRNMPAYGPQIPVRDRWAIVAYVRALQRSQNARLEDVPEDRRGTLR